MAADNDAAENAPARRPRLLVISQVYPPDPAAVGQYLAEASSAIAERGYDVRVLTSARGFDDPTAKYPPRETLDGVDVVRMPLSSFGKATIAHRIVGMLVFLTQTLVRGLFTPRLGGILVSTSPPLASTVAVIIGLVRGAPITYWVMDLNPDQMIELGKISERSLAARVFDFFNRLILRRSAAVVALDRFIGERLCRKHDVTGKMTVMPPWPHAEHAGGVPHAENPFRREHGLDGKFVVMYSGNHALTNPIETVIEAALRMQDRADLVFLFIGGGVRKKSVDDAIEQHRPTNIVSLPYQPLDTIRYSLSAADVHLVTLGDEAVGCVHPCKVYGAMALERPILYAGPSPSHVTDLLGEDNAAERIGWRIEHGDVDGAVRTIDAIRQTPADELHAMGGRAAAMIRERFDSQRMIDEFCEVVTGPINAR
ncbi:MAG: glycosyltransferase family 4 protein [Planctomycetota bacterium]